jgi:predicted kinase
MSEEIIEKPQFVLMAGLPGVGKTTLAKNIEKKLNYTVIEKDAIKDNFLKKLDEDQAGREAFDTAFRLVKERLDDGQSVILDSSALLPFVLQKATSISDDLQIPLKVILCTIDDGTRKRRLDTRKERPSQRRCREVGQAELQRLLAALPHDVTLEICTEEGKLSKYTERAIAHLEGTHRPFHMFMDFVRWNWKKTSDMLNSAYSPFLVPGLL